MGKAVFLYILIFFIMFLVGLTMAFFAFRFNKKKTHTALVIVFSVLLLPLMYLPMIFTVGFISRFIMILPIIGSVWMIVWAIKNKIK